MPTPEEEFRGLQDRHQNLIRQHAVLTEQQRSTLERKDKIRADLILLGVDPDKPQEEMQRLKGDIESFMTSARASLDEFEGKLKGTIPVEPPTTATSIGEILTSAEPTVVETSPAPAAEPPPKPTNPADDIDIG